jgi:TPR repeat protein
MPLLTEYLVQINKRIAVDDPNAYFYLGVLYSNGDPLANIPKGKAKAIELWLRAAELGSMKAKFSLGRAYAQGDGVTKDIKKGVHYYEQAAIAGCATSRHYIGVIEAKAIHVDRAKAIHVDRSQKHFQIAAGGRSLGALKKIQDAYMRYGLASKDEYEKALRAYQKYLDEVKTDQREEAAARDDSFQYLLDK